MAWKTHKPQCGKPLGISALWHIIYKSKCLPDVSSIYQDVAAIDHSRHKASPVDIPMAAPGFRRSPHLLRLIEHMTALPGKDYFLFPPPPEDDMVDAVTLDEVTGAAVFIVMRNRALVCGEEGAILYLYRVLQKQDPTGATHDRLRKQLRLEYQSSWDTVWRELCAGKKRPVNPVGREELEPVLMDLQKAGRFVKELKSYKKGAGDITPLGLKVGLSFTLFPVC